MDTANTDKKVFSMTEAAKHLAVGEGVMRYAIFVCGSMEPIRKGTDGTTSFSFFTRRQVELFGRYREEGLTPADIPIAPTAAELADYLSAQEVIDLTGLSANALRRNGVRKEALAFHLAGRYRVYFKPEVDAFVTRETRAEKSLAKRRARRLAREARVAAE